MHKTLALMTILAVMSSLLSLFNCLTHSKRLRTSLKESNAWTIMPWPPLTKQMAASSSNTSAFVLQHTHTHTDTHLQLIGMTILYNN